MGISGGKRWFWVQIWGHLGIDRACPGEADSLLSRAPPKDTNALSSQPAPPQQHPLPTNIPLPSVHPLHQPEQLIPLPREQPKKNPREGGEGTLAPSRLHRTHPPTPHTTSGVSPILLQNHSRVFPSPIPAGGTARGTEPSLGAQVVPGGASRDAAHPSSPYLCGTAWSGRRQRWTQTPGLCRLG